MVIISQIPAAVKWTEKKHNSLAVASALARAGLIERAQRMKQCGRWLTVEKCPECGKSHVSSASLCRDRLCPTCAWRLNLKRFAEMMACAGLITDMGAFTPAFLTLTVRNVRADKLRETLSKMAEDWNRFINRPKTKELVRGWARALEITYNRESHTFHPHYHIILLQDSDILWMRGMTPAECQTYYRSAWKKASRLDYEPITDYREIHPKNGDSGMCDSDKLAAAISETFKYATKSRDIEDMSAAELREYAAAISGIRMTAYGGIIKKARAKLGYHGDDLSETDTEPHIKCTCGSDMVKMIAQWSFERGQYEFLTEFLI